MAYPPVNHDSTFSERLYRLLLLAYPRAFREEYASEMLLVFREAYHDALHQQGMSGVLLLWSDFFSDFVKTVCIEHGRSWIQQSMLSTPHMVYNRSSLVQKSQSLTPLQCHVERSAMIYV